MFPFRKRPRCFNTNEQCFIGFIFSIRNMVRQIDWTGTPAQIIAHANAGGLSLNALANELETQIGVQKLWCFPKLISMDVRARCRAHIDLFDAMRAGDSIELDRVVAQIPVADFQAGGPLSAVSSDLAAATGSVLLLEKLNAAGRPIRASSIYGMNALHWSAAYGHVDGVKALIHLGVEPSVPNDLMWNSSDLATANQRTAAIKVLTRMGHRALPGLVTGTFLRMGIVPAK